MTYLTLLRIALFGLPTSAATGFLAGLLHHLFP